MQVVRWGGFGVRHFGTNEETRMSSSHHRPFRFGLQAGRAAAGSNWLDLARRAEDLGYSTLTMPDHFDDQLAPVPAMTAALAVTSSLRVCALVFDNDYKHPLVLAKELATMDVISNGRVEVGLGAGWMRTDYEQSGIPYDRPGVRIERFLEGLQIIRGLMDPEPFSFSGQHYTIANHNGTPKPVGGKCPPVLIGAGAPRMLGIAAREADIVGINPSMAAGAITPETVADMSGAATAAKIEIVREAAGDRFADIELNIRTFLVHITDDVDQGLQTMSKFTGASVEMLTESPFALIGPPSLLVEQLIERRERFGFSYVIVGGQDVESFAPVVAALAGS